MSEGSEKYKLKKPLKLGDDTISELEVRTDVVAGDMVGVKLDNLQGEDMIKMISNLTAQPVRVVSKLGLKDFMELSKIVGNAMSASQETGTN